MTTKLVLLLSQESDAHILPVQEAIKRLGGTVLSCDLADFPEHIQLSARLSTSSWSGTLLYQQQLVALEHIQSVWWRRPKRYHAPEDYAPAVRTFLNQEAYRGFLGLLLNSPNARRPFWVSRPDRIQAAEFKPSQLAAAQSLGLRIPKTLLTNDPAAVRDFYQECHGKIICKAVWQGSLHLEHDTSPSQARFIYTNQIQPEHLEQIDGVRTTAHFFQEYVEKALELRVVIIGRQLFAVEIYSQLAEQSSVDWRRDYSVLRYGVHQLSPDIEQKLFRLVQLFGLQYSSMDLIISPQGEYIWLELNACGQFGWLEPPTGLAMSEAMAHLLLNPEECGLW